MKQGDNELFILGASPSVLLKIGYVYRRASGKPMAYQRILNKDRITKITEFLSTDDALLPNAIIIAFDDDPAVQSEIKYENGKLYFPRKYCSAWIIDGQHRVFGFLNTRFENMDDDDPELMFELPVVAFKNLKPVWQNRTFVNINYNQKRIDPTLLCDLATALPDLQNQLTWPSLLVSELAKMEPLKGKIKISELDEGKTLSIASFAPYGLLEGLLGYDKKRRTYNGVLNKYSPFIPEAILEDATNQKALNEQVDLLRRYFDAVKQNTCKSNPRRDPWRNTVDYALLKPVGINALLLALARIMERYPKLEKDLHQDLLEYLKPLSKVKFSRAFIAKQGGYGWKGYRNLANAILTKINIENGDDLRLFGEKDKL
jgi:DGQHR domain-containing protein